MQSLTNAANAAKAAVFGSSEAQTQSTQSGTEPVSGITGSGTAGEPYDAGNNDGK